MSVNNQPCRDCNGAYLKCSGRTFYFLGSVSELVGLDMGFGDMRGKLDMLG